MTIEELQKQISLLETDAGIQSDKNYYREMTFILVRIHDLKLQLDREKSESQNKAIMEAIIYHYEELIKLQQHPQEIVEYFSKNRWLQLEDKPHVILDSYSGFLWPQMNTELAYKVLTTNEKLSALGNFQLDSFNNWKLPTKEVLQFSLYQNNFPYYDKQTNTICEERCIWIGGGNNPTYACDIKNDHVRSVNNALFLPYCNELVVKSYRFNQDENKYFVIQLLLCHNLQVVFDDTRLDNLYSQHYNQLYDFLLRSHALRNPDFKYVPGVILNDAAGKVQNIKLFSYKNDYDESKLNTSVLSYYPAASQLLREFITFITTTEKEQQPLIDVITDVSAQFENQTVVDFVEPIYNEIYSFLKIIEKSPLDELIAMENELARQFESLKGEQTIASLAQFEKLERPSFTLLKEYGEQITNRYIEILNLLSLRKDQLELITNWYHQIVEEIEKLDYTELINKWGEEFIDIDTSQEWIQEFEDRIMEIHLMYVPFVRDVLYGKLSIHTFIQIHSALQAQYGEIIQFYLHHRIEVHQKYAFQVGGELQEKLELQTLLYKLTGTLLKDTQQIAMQTENVEERKTLMTNMQPVFALPIDQINMLVGDISLIADILEEFHQLKTEQLGVFAEDTGSFVEAQQQRDAQYNSLMYKMRKQLMKQPTP